MTTLLSAQFTPAELNWLQVNLQAFNEVQWTSMGDSAHPIGGASEHGWFKDFLEKVRASIRTPAAPVVFSDVNELNFFRKWLIDYKNTSGEYIFQGPYGMGTGEGGQFPSMTGSANSNFDGQGSFPGRFFERGANIFNDILIKLGDVVMPPINPVVSSPGS